MRHGKHGIKLLSLLLLAGLATMALGAAAAQAEGEWKIGGKTFTELKIKEETVKGVADGVATLLLNGMGTEINCAKRELDEIKILAMGPMHGLLKWLECTMLQDTVVGGVVQLGEIPACIVAPFSTEFLSVVKLLSEKTYLLFVPSVGTSFATVKIEGAACALKGSFLLSGTYATTITGESVTQTLKTVDKETEASLGDGLKFGETKVTLTDTLLMTLSGAQAGKAWGGI